MPQMSGLELQRYLMDQKLQIPIVFISGHADIDMAVSCIHAGAIDFITKPIKQQRIIDAINKALRINLARTEQQQQTVELQQRLNTLSTREREILSYMIEKKLSKAISSELGISPNTVDNHRAKILSKMCVKTVSALIYQLGQHNLMADLKA